MKLVATLAFVLVACSKSPAPVAEPPANVPANVPTPAPANVPAPAPEATAPLKAGDAAPEVSFTLHDGRSVALSSLRGKRVLVYFYPKDDTPGCTVEAQGLRDRAADLSAAGIEVYGVSAQDADSHKAFIDKYQLPFPLVVDGDGKIAAAFHVPVSARGFASRQSFLVGKDGKLEAVWLDVDPSTHAADVLAVPN